MQKQITHKTNAKFAKQKEYKIIRNIILSAMTEKKTIPQNPTKIYTNYTAQKTKKCNTTKLLITINKNKAKNKLHHNV